MQVEAHYRDQYDKYTNRCSEYDQQRFVLDVITDIHHLFRCTIIFSASAGCGIDVNAVGQLAGTEESAKFRQIGVDLATRTTHRVLALAGRDTILDGAFTLVKTVTIAGILFASFTGESTWALALGYAVCIYDAITLETVIVAKRRFAE